MKKNIISRGLQSNSKYGTGSLLPELNF